MDQTIMESSIFRLELDPSPGIIKRLVRKGDYRGYASHSITDKRFPVNGAGIVMVRFRKIQGIDLVRADGYVRRIDVEREFKKEGMRFCDPVEALLPPAEDHELGKNNHKYVAFIRGLRGEFVVGETVIGWRELSHYSNTAYWNSRDEFIGVCE